LGNVSSSLQSLVLNSTEAWSVYIGAPAKRIKERSSNVLVLEKEYLNNEDTLYRE